jgi:hypothetical protein
MNLHMVHSYSEVITEALILSLELNITLYDAAFLSLTEKIGKFKKAKEHESIRDYDNVGNYWEATRH